MICKSCGSSKESRVIDSREFKEYVYRRRKCMNCGYVYMTHERFVRGCKSIYGPRVLFLNELENNPEAVWLELRTGRLSATSIVDMSEDTVFFDNGTNQSRKSCLHMWRVWDKRPSDIQRREEKWQ